MDALPHHVLCELLGWLPMRDVARAAPTCRTLCGAARVHASRESAARDALRHWHGPALDLRPGRALVACRRCELPGVRPYAELLAYVGGPRPLLDVWVAGGTELASWWWYTGQDARELAGFAAASGTPCASASAAAGSPGLVVLAYDAHLGSMAPAPADMPLALLRTGTVVRVRWRRDGEERRVLFVAAGAGARAYDCTSAHHGAGDAPSVFVKWPLTRLGRRPCACAPKTCRWRMEVHCAMRARDRGALGAWCGGALCARLAQDGLPLSEAYMHHWQRAA